MKIDTYKFSLLFSLFCLLLIGCASTSYITPGVPPSGIPGTYHRVEKGQTLWGISKIYNTDLDEIVGINHISNASNIETGQLLFIPGVQKSSASPLKYSLEDFIWPIRGKVISGFGETFDNMVNKGINIQPYSEDDVVAVRRGRVVFYSANFSGLGKTFIIDHGDGFLTVYANISEVFIKSGDSVEKGSVIARVGSSVRAKVAYLHFQIRKNHIPQNPYFYLPR